jgi:hypothetical protein
MALQADTTADQVCCGAEGLVPEFASLPFTQVGSDPASQLQKYVTRPVLRIGSTAHDDAIEAASGGAWPGCELGFVPLVMPPPLLLLLLEWFPTRLVLQPASASAQSAVAADRTRPEAFISPPWVVSRSVRPGKRMPARS